MRSAWRRPAGSGTSQDRCMRRGCTSRPRRHCRPSGARARRSSHARRGSLWPRTAWWRFRTRLRAGCPNRVEPNSNSSARRRSDTARARRGPSRGAPNREPERSRFRRIAALFLAFAWDPRLCKITLLPSCSPYARRRSDPKGRWLAPKSAIFRIPSRRHPGRRPVCLRARQHGLPNIVRPPRFRPGTPLRPPSDRRASAVARRSRGRDRPGCARHVDTKCRSERRRAAQSSSRAPADMRRRVRARPRANTSPLGLRPSS